MKRVLEESKDDCGAPLEPEAIDALTVIKKTNPAEFVRVRNELKKTNREISVASLDDAMKAKAVKDDIAPTHHGYACNMINVLTNGEWAPVGHEGSLYVVDSDNLWVELPVETLTRRVAEIHDGEKNCERVSDYKGIANHAITLATNVDFFSSLPSP